MDLTQEYIEKVIKVVIFIEDNIDREITMEELAKVACYSPFHFHRIFHAVMGETLHNLVKRLRLEKAAMKLAYSEYPITEIALDANFETPSSFTKAFKQFWGSSPKKYRSLHSKTQAMIQKIQELSMIKPDKIEKHLPDLNLLFVRRYGSYAESPKNAWDVLWNFIEEKHLDLSKLRYFGISHDDPVITNEEKLRYDAAILAPFKVETKKEVGKQHLKGGKYAIFTHYGSYAELEKTFNSIFLKWLPQSMENFDETRSVFCEYFHLEYVKTNPEKLVTKIFIPLV